MCQTKIVEKIKTHILYFINSFLPRKPFRVRDGDENVVEPDR